MRLQLKPDDCGKETRTVCQGRVSRSTSADAHCYRWSSICQRRSTNGGNQFRIVGKFVMVRGRVGNSGIIPRACGELGRSFPVIILSVECIVILFTASSELLAPSSIPI